MGRLEGWEREGAKCVEGQGYEIVSDDSACNLVDEEFTDHFSALRFCQVLVLMRFET